MSDVITLTESTSESIALTEPDDAPTSTEVIDELIERCEAHADLGALIEASLTRAKLLGEAELDRVLYDALKWPESLDEYMDYLQWFARYIPRQSRDQAWTAPRGGGQQEVYDHLCHFYWLVDQPIVVKDSDDKADKKIVENDPWFSQWLIRYANAWGRFLDTTESFDRETLESFIKESPEYRVQDSMIDGKPNAPSGWLTFNQFFARELNPGLRPISSPNDNSVVTSPADCTFHRSYPIGPNSEIEGITVKKTHTYASVEHLLDGSPYADAFANGTYAHYFLGPYSYHRFHTPVAGMLKECRRAQGLVYLEVNLQNGQFDAPDTADGGYEFNQARGIVVVDTANSPAGDVGLVGIVPVGMAQVSSVNMTAQVGNYVAKGEEFGYFLFGGSDIILLFQEGVNPDVYDSTRYRHYGTPSARLSVG